MEWTVVGKKEKDKAIAKREERLGGTVDMISQRHATFQDNTQPVALRFEAEGDGRFASSVLGALHDRKIPFQAEVHNFEGEDHPNFQATAKKMARFGEAVTHRGNQDFARDSTGSQSQDFIFTRNLALTDSTGMQSRIDFKGTQTVHKDGIRRRSNSLVQGGELVVGGSGFPFVQRNPENKSQITNNDLMGLKKFARRGSVGLSNSGSYVDREGVMKNQGTSLSGGQGARKETVMHRFQKL